MTRITKTRDSKFVLSFSSVNKPPCWPNTNGTWLYLRYHWLRALLFYAASHTVLKVLIKMCLICITGYTFLKFSNTYGRRLSWTDSWCLTFIYVNYGHCQEKSYIVIYMCLKIIYVLLSVRVIATKFRPVIARCLRHTCISILRTTPYKLRTWNVFKMCVYFNYINAHWNSFYKFKRHAQYAVLNFLTFARTQLLVLSRCT